MDKEHVVNAFYVPMSSLDRAVELLETTVHFGHDTCKRNLAVLQQNRTLHLKELKERNWRNQYRMAIRRAIYSHRWDDLAYLLKKSPIWEQETKFDLPIYVRALTILLMNHPTAKAQGLLQDYLHMALACRSDQSKQALYKAILSLTPKLFNKKQRGN